MTKYRKKPVVIDAFKWTGGPDQTEDPLWIIEAMKRGQVRIIQNREHGTVVHIDTLEGVMTGRVGDYIIRGIKGEMYPCKPDIFEATYELVGDGEEEDKEEVDMTNPMLSMAPLEEGVTPVVIDASKALIDHWWGMEQKEYPVIIGYPSARSEEGHRYMTYSLSCRYENATTAHGALLNMANDLLFERSKEGTIILRVPPQINMHDGLITVRTRFVCVTD